MRKIRIITLYFSFWRRGVGTTGDAPEAIELHRQSVDKTCPQRTEDFLLGFRTCRADLLPEVGFLHRCFDYGEAIICIKADRATFVRTNSLGMTGDISIDQNIWLTGGALPRHVAAVHRPVKYSRGSSLLHERTYRGDALPAYLRGEQHEVERRIEPVRYNEAKAAYSKHGDDYPTHHHLLLPIVAREREHEHRGAGQGERRPYLRDCRSTPKDGQISENQLLQLKLLAPNESNSRKNNRP